MLKKLAKIRGKLLFTEIRTQQLNRDFLEIAEACEYNQFNETGEHVCDYDDDSPCPCNPTLCPLLIKQKVYKRNKIKN